MLIRIEKSKFKQNGYTMHLLSFLQMTHFDSVFVYIF